MISSQSSPLHRSLPFKLWSFALFCPLQSLSVWEKKHLSVSGDWTQVSVFEETFVFKERIITLFESTNSLINFYVWTQFWSKYFSSYLFTFSVHLFSQHTSVYRSLCNFLYTFAAKFHSHLFSFFNTHEQHQQQCDQMARLFCNIWPITALKSCPKYQKIAKVGSKFCQTLDKLSTVRQRLIKICQSGEILPILITLAAVGLTRKLRYVLC